MKRIGWALLVALVAVIAAWPAVAQDLNTQLTYFLVDMRNGTWGTTVTPSSMTLSNTAGIATTSTNGIMLGNGVAATGGATVQMSPRILLRGNAWDTAASQTVDFLMENLPASAATPVGTWKLGYSRNGGAVTYPMTVGSDGFLTLLSSVQSGSHVIAAAGSGVAWTGRVSLRSSADKLLQQLDAGATTGLELNGGTPTLGTCTGGSMTSGSHNTAGQYTGNTSGSCVINFGTPNFTNTPFCFAMSTASTTHPRISSSANSSITVTGGVSGEAIQFFCIGRIGT